MEFAEMANLFSSAYEKNLPVKPIVAKID